MQKSALKLKNEGKEKVRVEAQPEEPTEQERLEHEATHIPLRTGARVVWKPRVNRIMKRRTLKLARILLESRILLYSWTLCFLKERIQLHWLESVLGHVCQW